MTKTSLTVVMDFDEKQVLALLNNVKTPSMLPEHMDPGEADRVRNSLRGYVDAWISSGILDEQSESPYARSDERVADSAYSPNSSLDALMLFNCFGFFRQSHELRVWYPPTASAPSLQLTPRPVKASERAHQHATALMVGVLSTDLRYRIAKCRYQKCGHYFLLSERRRERYANGIFCRPSCNRAASAARLTTQRRRLFNPTVIEWAARELSGQGCTEDDSLARKKKLLLKLNKRFARHKDPNLCGARKQNRDGSYVALNWLTRHWTEIQVKALEIGDGKK
jgi:hypothetical protein